MVFERHVQPGAGAAFRAWSERFLEAAKRSPGHEGGSVLAVPNGDSQFVLVRFASAATLEQWQRSVEFAALMREADVLGRAGEYSETRSGMESWFTLPGKPMPSRPPANWKMALTTWVALLPMVVALGYVFRPFGLPVLLEQALSTIIPVVVLTWVVMPALTRFLYEWLYAERTT